MAQQVVITVPPVCPATWNYHYIDLLNSTKSKLISLRATHNPKIRMSKATRNYEHYVFLAAKQVFYFVGYCIIQYGDHSCWPCKEESGELAASARQYLHPPSFDHDVDNIGLSFEELKQRHIEQALQQCQDRNGPLAKAMIDMIENPPPPFESSDDDETTNNVLIRKRKRKGNRGKSVK